MVAVGTPKDPNQEMQQLDRHWSIVAFCSACLAFSVGTLLLYSFGVFIRPLSAEFHWSRTQVAGAVAIGQLVVSLSAPVWGLLVDRFSPRRVILVSVVGMSLSYASLMWLTPHLWHLYLVYATFTLLGGAASPVGYSAVLVRNFERRLGLALGLALTGIGLGAILLPRLAEYLIEKHGWRSAYGVIGVATLLITVPAALFATRYSRPPVSRTSTSGAPVLSLVLSRPFLVLSLIFFSLGVASGGVIVNLVTMMIERGFTPSNAAGVASVAGVTVLFGRGGVGYLLDRWNGTRLLACVALLTVAVSLLLAYVPGRQAGYAASLTLGLVLGAEVDVAAYMMRQYFSKAVFGRLYGVLFGIGNLGFAVGPLFLSVSYDHRQSFHSGLLILSSLGVIAAALTFVLPPYSPLASEA